MSSSFQRLRLSSTVILSSFRRIRDKYEAEFRELEHSEKQTKERFNQIKAEMTEVEGENERLQVILKQKETEINDIRKVSSSFFFSLFFIDVRLISLLEHLC